MYTELEPNNQGKHISFLRQLKIIRITFISEGFGIVTQNKAFHSAKTLNHIHLKQDLQ